MEPEGSLPCSQQPDTGPYPEPDASSPQPLNLFSRLVKGAVVRVFNQIPRHEDVCGSGGTAPRILNLGTTKRCVFSFKPRPPHTRGILRLVKVKLFLYLTNHHAKKMYWEEEV
jgi:hypothetical protein